MFGCCMQVTIENEKKKMFGCCRMVLCACLFLDIFRVGILPTLQGSDISVEA